MVKAWKLAVLVLSAAAAVPAGAATTIHAFATTGAMSDNGAYGNALAFSALADASLKLRITGWQANQSTNDVTRAYVGAYGGGLGITGIGDQNGGNALHQIDNVGGYNDFVLLQFNRAVTLSGITANVYQMGGVSGRDSDFAFFNAGVLPASSWNAAMDLTVYDNIPSIWTEVAAGSSSGFRSVTAGEASNRWLVSAAFLPTTDRDDGFKLSALRVSEQVAAVPEPATWAMMLLGFFGVGGAMRRAGRRSPRIAGGATA